MRSLLTYREGGNSSAGQALLAYALVASPLAPARTCQTPFAVRLMSSQVRFSCRNIYNHPNSTRRRINLTGTEILYALPLSYPGLRLLLHPDGLSRGVIEVRQLADHLGEELPGAGQRVLESGGLV